MLSYQHSYHAGCLADVHKHSHLLAVLRSLVAENAQKIQYMETHAGRGLYQLDSKEAQKTQEAEKGILAALKKPDAWQKPLCDFIHEHLNQMHYPGSPLIAAHCLKETDRLYLAELHKQENKALKETMDAFKNVQIAKKDGYSYISQLNLPRADIKFIHIDPSYEVKEEYQAVVDFIKHITAKWPEVKIMLWYPKLKSALHKPMLASLKELYPNAQITEQDWQEAANIERMQGTGLFKLNI